MTKLLTVLGSTLVYAMAFLILAVVFEFTSLNEEWGSYVLHLIIPSCCSFALGMNKYFTDREKREKGKR